MKKLFKIIACFALLISMLILPTSASSRAVGCEASTWYSPSTTLTKTSINDTITLKNSSSITQSYSKSYSSTRYSSMTISGSASSSQSSFGLITYAVQISAEASVSTSTTVTRTVNVSVPANSTVTAKVGYAYVSTSGYIKTQNTDCSVGSVKATAEYTYGDYVEYNQS